VSDSILKCGVIIIVTVFSYC